MKRFIPLFLILLLAAVFVIPAGAEAKTALVIGNGAYKYLPDLTNPVPEALEMKNALENAGFKVIYVTNCSKREMQGAVIKFNEELERNGGIGLFHYGGHGMQLNGKNYLLPVDANIKKEWEVDSYCVDANYILGAMENSRSSTNIIILDACRDNPLPAVARSTSTRGLARIEAPTNSIIVYSASEGEIAQDGLFTPILVKYIRQGDMEFSDMIKAVRKDVIQVTGGDQQPAAYEKLTGDIWITTPVGYGSSGTVTLENKTGGLSVTVNTKGDLYIDGVKKTVINPGQIANVSDLNVGTHHVEIRYSGNTEMQTVTITENRVTTAVFTWQREENLRPDDGNMVFIQGGTFMMGSPLSEPERYDNEIQHSVTVSSFYMGKYEVTFNEYDAFCSATSRQKPSDSGWGRGTRPVINVNWYDAVEYCNWRSIQEGLTPVYTINKSKKDPQNKSVDDNLKWMVTVNWNASGYRLPTEAEWEYACRAGTTTPFNTGNNINTAQANYNSNYPYNGNARGEYRCKTLPVGSFQPNPWGLYDMHGNVLEWCQDWYSDYSSESQTDPNGPSGGSDRVFRGGSWYYFGLTLRSSFRGYNPPSVSRNYGGFRIIRTS